MSGASTATAELQLITFAAAKCKGLGTLEVGSPVIDFSAVAHKMLDMPEAAVVILPAQLTSTNLKRHGAVASTWEGAVAPPPPLSTLFFMEFISEATTPTH